jgi:hypothetical protein
VSLTRRWGDGSEKRTDNCEASSLAYVTVVKDIDDARAAINTGTQRANSEGPTVHEISPPFKC